MNPADKLIFFFPGMDQFDRDSTIADFKNGVTNLMVRVMTSNTVVKLQRIKERMEGITNK